MVQVVDLTDCTRGKLTCSIKEGRKHSHPRKSAEMSSQWKRNNPEKPNAGSWTRRWMKSPDKDITSSAVMCATPPYWSDPFRKSKELSLFSSLSDKTYVTITAKLLHIIRRKKTSKEVGRLGLASIDSGLGEFQTPILH